MFAASVPSSLATYLATSTSKPVYSEPFFSPRPGWSNLMPTFRPPAPALPDAVLSDPVSPASEPQAVSARVIAAAAAAAPFVEYSSVVPIWWCGGCRVPRRLLWMWWFSG